MLLPKFLSRKISPKNRSIFCLKNQSCYRRKDASLYFFRWFGSISMESVQTMCLEVNTSCSERNPDFGLFWTI